MLSLKRRKSSVTLSTDAVTAVHQDAAGKPAVPLTSALGLAANLHAPTSNTAAVVTYAASPSNAHVIRGVAWSYDGAPTAGNLKIENVSGTTVFSADITAAGPGSIQFNPALRSSVNVALIVTLAAGGSGVSGKLNVLGKSLEAN